MITTNRERRQRRIRAKVSGTAERPRASVYRSQTGFYVQLIDDTAGRTLLAVKSSGTSTAAAEKLGARLGEAAVKQGITKAVFDRGGFLYHGRVKAVAEGLRQGGLLL